jgi:hypothetical protein
METDFSKQQVSNIMYCWIFNHGVYQFSDPVDTVKQPIARELFLPSCQTLPWFPQQQLHKEIAR